MRNKVLVKIRGDSGSGAPERRKARLAYKMWSDWSLSDRSPPQGNVTEELQLVGLFVQEFSEISQGADSERLFG
uniref:Uncharacterized protein n=1 Tax=Knipowitschia caucasica TaxID=637954 RepID=A0AAV2M006_KNICA